MLILSSVVITLSINYWIIIPLVPLIAIFVYVRKYFLVTSIEIKRIDATNRSPIYVHINSTLSGIIAIRASNVHDKLYEEFNTHTDYHTRAVAGYIYLNRWFAVRLDWIASGFIFFAVFSCILLKDRLGISQGQIGIMLVYLCHMLPIFQWCMRQSCEVENLMTSVERILEYTALDAEPLETGLQKPPVQWPHSGLIQFDDVSFSYAKNLPPVLNNLTFAIQPREKVGVVGRTGAGKSSIIQALFRMAEPSGSIRIDGVDIRQLSLHDLRKKISIIPVSSPLFPLPSCQS